MHFNNNIELEASNNFILKKKDKYKIEVDNKALEEYYKAIDSNYKTNKTSKDSFSKDSKSSKKDLKKDFNKIDTNSNS